jgi:hypothetical protein
VDKEVKDTVQKIFNTLRKRQPKMGSRKSDRIGGEKMIRDYQELEPHIQSKE